MLKVSNATVMKEKNQWDGKMERYFIVHFYLLPRFFLLLSIVVDYLYPMKGLPLFFLMLLVTAFYDSIFALTTVHLFRKEPTPKNLPELQVRVSLFSLSHYSTSLLFILHLILNSFVWSFIPYCFYLVLVPISFSSKLYLQRKVTEVNLLVFPTIHDTLAAVFIIIAAVVSFILHPWYLSLFILILGFLHLSDLSIVSSYRINFCDMKKKENEGKTG